MTEATLLSAGERPVLRFERFLARPVADVWRAVTDPDELRAWFPTRIEVERWERGASLVHHFDDWDLDPLPGRVLECEPPHRLVFTWGEDTIGFALTPVAGGTRFVLTEELAAPRAALNASGWEVCLARLVGDRSAPDWRERFDHYTSAYGAALGAQDGPPAGSHG